MTLSIYLATVAGANTGELRDMDIAPTPLGPLQCTKVLQRFGLVMIGLGTFLDHT